MKRYLFFLLTVLVQSSLNSQSDQSVYREFSLEVSTEYSYFFNEGLYQGQKQHFPSIAVQPEYYMEWADGRHSITFKGFARLDRDNYRTHWDLRELYWLTYRGNWELSAGLKKIYWGTTESAHLVDIINQTDQVESFDGEEKLGQPMVHFSLSGGIGTFDLFAMPYFRSRAFPGKVGRLRTPVILTDNDFVYQSDLDKWHPDFAIRWSNALGPLDIGLSHFWGTGREPVFLLNRESGSYDLIYAINHQTGLDAQITTGPWLLKLESIVRLNDYQDVFALAGGFEYTFSNIRTSGVDVGLLSEYLCDSRGRNAIGSLDNDIFLGGRIALNDVQSTEILLGGIFDLRRSTKMFSVEASRRFGNNWMASAEARILANVSSEEFVYFIRDDSFAKVNLTWFF